MISLPLSPLIHAYRARGLPTVAALHALPGLGPRFAAVLGASARFLYADFLDRASDEAFHNAIGRFYESACEQALHAETLRRRAGFVRHGLSHLLRGVGPMAEKLEACLAADGAYRVPGLGPSFWSALVQGLAPSRYPAWTAATLAGARRLGFVARVANLPYAATYRALTAAHDRIRAAEPAMTTLHCDHFLSLVAEMVGRDLFPREPTADPVEHATKRLRAATPLRERLKARGQEIADAQKKVEAALAVGEAVSGVPHELAARLWRDDDPYPALGESWRGAALLHLRDPQRFIPFDDPVRRGLATLDDGTGDAAAERYRLANEAAFALRERYGLHPLELPEVLAALGQPAAARDGFEGFCTDTFAFLGELSRQSRRAWSEQARERYLWAVRRPLTELRRALTERYILPVLGGVHGWRLAASARTSPRHPAARITFRAPGGAARFVVRLDPDGVRCGLRLGRRSTADRLRLRANVERHGDALRRLLGDNNPLNYLSLDVATFVAADPALTSEELVGRIAAAFDRLLPLYAACVEDDAGPALLRLGGDAPPRGYCDSDFRRDTYLDDAWLRRAHELLSLKKQLVLQGVPGTGKTHVARSLARLLTGGHDEAVRLVQFHPAYSYEEFVEGIRVRSVSVDGRQEVSYPVEEGLLCAFAARAAAKPSQPHVLIVDEINRGNLPRIFGELLYLLEYRGCAVELPYSRRDFRLPPNLFLIATMNAADRSLALVDQALRRRFSFLQMEPDAAVLAAWLRACPPAGGSAFASRVLGLFDRLNARLAAEAGPHARVGHSFFMTARLDEAKLRVIWQHHVRPWLDEVHAGQPGRAAAYDALLGGARPKAEASLT